MLARETPELATHTGQQLLFKVFVLVEAVLQVIQAELVATSTAGHVVAAFELVDCDGALRTLHSSILLLPL